MIGASMTITDERKNAADISDPYYDVPSRWVAKAGVFKDASPALLKGQKIIGLHNSPHAKFVAQPHKDAAQDQQRHRRCVSPSPASCSSY